MTFREAFDRTPRSTRMRWAPLENKTGSAQVAGLTDLVGNTPLLRISRCGPDNRGVSIYAKAEWFNPGGSVKDRPALHMLLAAERSGRLIPGKTIIDATSGNTGIAFAMLGAALGYRVALALPANASKERKQTIAAYGAEIILTDQLAGTDGAQTRVKEIVAEINKKFSAKS